MMQRTIKSNFGIDYIEYVGPSPASIIAFFHGLGEVGKGINAVEVNEIPKRFKNGETKNCICLAFYKPSGTSWYARELVSALNVIEEYRLQYNLPIISTGLSLGAMAQFTLAQEAYKKFGPKYFSAIGVVCGKTGISDMTPFLGIPVRLWHGTNDSTLPISNARSFYKKLKEAGGDVSMIEYAGMNHNIWGKAYSDEADAFWSWIAAIEKQDVSPGIATSPVIKSEISDDYLILSTDTGRYKLDIQLRKL
jgi:predicted peptidase